MTQKKKKSPADSLIDSLIDDLKDVREPTRIPAALKDNANELTLDLHSSEDEKTIPISQSAESEPVTSVPKVTFGLPKALTNSTVAPRIDAHIQQAENLRLAQKRILELESYLDKVREENEQLSSAAEITRIRSDELIHKVQALEKIKTDIKEQSESELKIFRDNLQSKDRELYQLRIKLQELENRLQSDMRKIRVRERELENRLELSKMEKNALIRSKDEIILDHKRKIDQLVADLESYKEKCIELNTKIDSNQEQFARTVRALRLALTNLEVHENTTAVTVATFKKAD